MSKIADTYLKTNPWKIIEEGWNKEKNMVSESIFSLGNEYMGVRGLFEEGTSESSLSGFYFNGVYEIEPVENTSYKGIVNKTHFMVNSTDWLYTRISAGGELLVPGISNISDFVRELDLRTGLLTRSYVWTTSKKHKIKLSFFRFLNMEIPELSYQKIEITEIDNIANAGSDIKILLALDGNSIHATRNKCYWDEISQKKYPIQSHIASLYLNTQNTKQRLLSSFLWDTDIATKINDCKFIQNDKFCGYELSFQLEPERTAVVYKQIVNIVEKKQNTDIDKIFNKADLLLAKSNEINFDMAFDKNKEYWNHVWNHSDIEIDGDEKNQQGIRFCIFQMNQTYHGYSNMNNIGAKGLTGEAYNGHTFWDTETCCLPFYLFTDISAAKNLLEYRYSTLKQAKERAIQLDCLGACYPVATLNGEEACNLFQHASCQFQPSTGVAYGIQHYVNVSQDEEFLFSHGLEMLVEICRFLASRGSWNSSKTGFGFYAVMGPDEFHMMVNNNTYTNFMAKKTFEYTLSVLDKLKKKDFNGYEKILNKLSLENAEIENFQKCCDKMIILYNDKSLVYEQHEGYSTMPHIDVSSIPVTDFPLYSHWSYDRIYRTDMIKQPDVLMFIFLFSSLFPLNVKLENYNYYEPRTIHESSLSPSIHSILAEELGKHEEAAAFFEFATRMDLDNYNRNTSEGLHTTSIAAAWMNIVYGFGGMRSDSTILSFNPTLPSLWKKYSFKVVYRENVISVCVSEGKSSFSSFPETSEIIIYGNHHLINQKPLIVNLLEKTEKCQNQN